jgi:hypothetical protein
MKRAVLIVLMLALLALSSALASASQFIVCPGSKFEPPISSATEDVCRTHDAMQSGRLLTETRAEKDCLPDSAGDRRKEGTGTKRKKVVSRGLSEGRHSAQALKPDE